MIWEGNPSSLAGHGYALSPSTSLSSGKTAGAWRVVLSDVFQTGLKESHDSSLRTLGPLYLWPEACRAERSPVWGRAWQKGYRVCTLFLGGLSETSEIQHGDSGLSEAQPDPVP